MYAGRLSSMAGFERLVAIKVIHEHLSSEPSFIKMFLDEARIAAGIHHPNVGEILEVGEDEGMFFMVGELIQGQSLFDLFRTTKAKEVEVPHGVIAYLGANICHALQAAHELRGPEGRPLNLVHRDISPKNILISYDGFVKLIDFGVAWARGRLSHTDVGTLKGKIGFMPPEQIRGEPLDQRSDLFSLGVVMYLMLTRRHPYSGKSEAERLHKILYGEAIPPSRVNPAVDKELEKIVMTAMAHKRDDRYVTASVMGQELEDYARSAGKRVGTTDLSSLMREVFAEEIVSHEEKLREYRKSHEHSLSSDVPEAIMRSSSPGPPPVPLRKPEESELDASSAEELSVVEGDPESTWVSRSLSISESSSKQPRKLRYTRWILGVVGILIIGAVVFWLSPWRGKLSISKPVAKAPAAASVGKGAAASARSATGEAAPPAERDNISITFDVQPESAAILLDGTMVKKGTKKIELPGDGKAHTVELWAQGYKTISKTITADGNQTFAVFMEPLLESVAEDDEESDRGSRSSSSKRRKKDKKTELRSSPYD